MQRILNVISVLYLLSLFGCGPQVDADMLAGNWNASALLEEGRPKEVVLEDTRFVFDALGSYSYHSALNYKEAGRYRLQNQLLYTSDTTATRPTEKVVRIIRLDKDSLFLDMNDRGKTQLMKLYRVPAPPE